MIVVGTADGHSQKFGILGDSPNHSHAEDQELCIFVRRRTGIQKVFAIVGRHGPVIVLARTIDAGKRLFVEQSGQSILRSRATNHFHHELIVVGSQVRIFENRRNFVLAGGHFIMAGLHRNSSLNS